MTTNYLDDKDTPVVIRVTAKDQAFTFANALTEYERAKQRNLKRADIAQYKAAMEKALADLTGISRTLAREYDNAMIDRVSAMDGKTVCKVRRADIGTVNDPGMERHWTM
jgi:hypothetical protein